MTSEDLSRWAKRTSLLQRRPGLSVDAFRAHWAGPHAAIACTMPGIARYTQNRVDQRLLAWSAQGPAYESDGIVELEFHDEAWARASTRSETALRLLPEDELRFMGAITLCRVACGARQTWPGHVKVMLAARLAGEPAAALKTLASVLHQSGCKDSSVEAVRDTFHRDTLRYEQEPPHVFATLWFDPAADLAEVVDSRSEWMRAARACIGRGSLWRCDPLKIVDTLSP